jgi:hypothetical protein
MVQSVNVPVNRYVVLNVPGSPLYEPIKVSVPLSVYAPPAVQLVLSMKT